MLCNLRSLRVAATSVLADSLPQFLRAFAVRSVGYPEEESLRLPLFANGRLLSGYILQRPSLPRAQNVSAGWRVTRAHSLEFS